MTGNQPPSPSATPNGTVDTPVAAALVDESAPAPTSGEFWIFGYGSLIWKPPPHFDRRVPGWVTGYVRRFWQSSTPNKPKPSPKHTTGNRSQHPSQDHRGTPEAPGRVVTLLERSFWESLIDHHDSAPDKVWGVAYRIAADRAAEVREYLDIREINGYTIHYTPFYPAESSLPPFSTMVYIGTPENPQFTGPQEVQALAEHIFRSSGPSGPNRDYLLGLETALDALSPESGDEHVTDLSNRLRTLIAEAAEVDKDPSVHSGATAS